MALCDYTDEQIDLKLKELTEEKLRRQWRTRQFTATRGYDLKAKVKPGVITTLTIGDCNAEIEPPVMVEFYHWWLKTNAGHKTATEGKSDAG